MELPLTQPYVWVHYKTIKLPVPEWRAELSQLCPGPSKPLAKLTLILGLDEVYMSLLRVMLQAQILAEAGNRPPGKGKVAEAVQWAVSILGEDQLPFKTTAAVFGCIPECRETSPGLDSMGLTEFEGSAMESDVL